MLERKEEELKSQAQASQLARANTSVIIIVRGGEEKERKRWTAERSALIRAMKAIVMIIVGVRGVKFPTAVLITALKGMDTMEMLETRGPGLSRVEGA